MYRFSLGLRARGGGGAGAEDVEGPSCEISVSYSDSVWAPNAGDEERRSEYVLSAVLVFRFPSTTVVEIDIV